MAHIKQVIVMRKDLNMRKGKMVAQGAHASLAAIMNKSQISKGQMIIPYDKDVASWFEDRFTKICLGCTSEQELLEIFQKAKNVGLTAALITDAGVTEFDGVPTKTCIAIGPNRADKIDKVTGHLKLL